MEKSFDITMMNTLFQFMDCDKLQLYIIQRLGHLSSADGGGVLSSEQLQDLQTNVDDLKNVLPSMLALVNYKNQIEDNRLPVPGQQVKLEDNFQKKLCELSASLLLLRTDAAATHHESPAETYQIVCEIFVITLQLCNQTYANLLLGKFLNLSLNSLRHFCETSKCSSVNQVSTAAANQQDISVSNIVQLLCHLYSQLWQQSETGNKTLQHFLNDDTEHYDCFVQIKAALLTLLRFVDDCMVKKILLELFPKINAVIDSSTDLKHFLINTWDIVTQCFRLNELGRPEEVNSSGFLILSCISNQMFSSDAPNEDRDYPIWATASFIQILQYGLVHSNPLPRKRSLYFLKRALDCLENKNIEIPSPVFDGLFSWIPRHSEEIQQVFADIMLVLETLEEKQVHVIKPLFPIVCSLISQATEKETWFLPASWLIVIFQRLLKHDNKAVRKWAIEQICDLDFKHFPLFKQGLEKFFLYEFLEAVNDTHLYTRQPNESLETCAITANKIKLLYQYCHQALQTTEKQAEFFQQLLRQIRSQSWGTVALCYVSRALASLPPSPLWNKTSISDLREVLIYTLRTHEVLLRGAIQGFMLEAFIKLIDLTDVTVDDVSSLMVIFKRDECLERGNPLYTHVVTWLQHSIHSKNVLHPNLAKDVVIKLITEKLKTLLDEDNSYLNESIIIRESREVLRVVRILVLLSDAKVLAVGKNEPINNIRASLTPLMDILTSCHSRPYMASAKIDKSLQFLLTLASEVKQVTNSTPDDLETYVASCFEAVSSTFLPYATNRLFNEKNISHGRIQLYFSFLENVVKNCPFSTTLQSYLIDLCQKSLHILAAETESGCFLKRYIAVKCFSIAFIFVEFFEDIQDRFKMFCINDFMKLCKKGIILSTVPKDLEVICFADVIHKSNPNVIRSDYITTAWFCVSCYIKYTKLETAEEEILLDQTLEAQDVGSSESLKLIFNCLELILSQVIERDEEKVVHILETSWKTLFEMKQNVIFWDAMTAFINMAFQPKLMNNAKIAIYLSHYATKICERSEACQGLFLPLVRRVSEIWKIPDNQPSMLKNMGLLVQALTFGHVHRKDQRVIQDAEKFIAQEPGCINQLSDSHHLYESEVRVQAVILLLKLKCNLNRCDILSCLVNCLIDYEQTITKTRSRHFANSLVHRVKQRVWQTLLVLEPMNPEDLDGKLLDTIFLNLVEESLQPSVRYLMEWLALKILYRFPSMTDKLWTAFDWATQRRIGSLGSFLAIICNLGKVLPNTSYKIDFIQKAIPVILPWCMAQHFNTRIYAQVALNKIWKCCKANQGHFEQIIDRYSPLENLFTGSHDHCSTSKGIQKLLEDYNFDVFHHLNHYTLETIFYELPRLSNVTPEEWIEPALFEKCDPFLQSSQSNISLYNLDNALSSCESGSFLSRIAVNNFPESVAHENKDFQKKLTPWKQMIVNCEATAVCSDTIAVKKQQEGLVVVASLIDRPPNLGGLCRTCEVFGVSQYIVGNLRYTEDKQFQSLSVSAEKWVQIKEVKPQNLQDYLLAVKKCGYTVVGAEQTANSCKLDSFKFPKKTVLILGNEKEGIPVEIIQLLDICIEIPQQGLIRSLNVHVTGAILIWEYTRQQLSNTA